MNEQVNESSVGDLCFTLRKAQGITQKELSKRLGVVQSTVSKIETNIFEEVPFSYVDKTARLFKVPLDTFQKGSVKLSPKELRTLFSKEHIEHGKYSPELIYKILNALEHREYQRVCKKLKIRREYFSVQNVLFSDIFAAKICMLMGDKLLIILKKIEMQSADFYQFSELAESYFKIQNPKKL